jgi:hypothetical protein
MDSSTDYRASATEPRGLCSALLVWGCASDGVLWPGADRRQLVHLAPRDSYCVAMTENGAVHTALLLASIDARLNELRELGKRLEVVGADLPDQLRELALFRAEPQVTEDEIQEMLRATLRRVDTALRSRKASVDLFKLREVSEPSSAVEIARRWVPQRPRGAAKPYDHPRVVDRLDDVTRYPSRDPDIYFTTGRSYIAAEPGQVDAVWIAAREMLTRAGYEILVEGQESSGSVWKDWAIKGSRKAAKNLAEGSAAAVTDSYVRRPGAQATSEFAQASAGLISAMGDREGVHMFDNLIVGQFRGPDGELRSFTKELTLLERRTLDSNPALLAEPAFLLARLNQPEQLLPPENEPPAIDAAPGD